MELFSRNIGLYIIFVLSLCLTPACQYLPKELIHLFGDPSFVTATQGTSQDHLVPGSWCSLGLWSPRTVWICILLKAFCLSIWLPVSLDQVLRSIPWDTDRFGTSSAMRAITNIIECLEKPRSLTDDKGIVQG